MSVTIRVRPNGPLLIEGPSRSSTRTATPSRSTPISRPWLSAAAANRASRPFCDGTHKRCGFQSVELAPAPATCSRAHAKSTDKFSPALRLAPHPPAGGKPRRSGRL